MARELSITQEQINAVADSIRATGQKPTARSVREAIGTGSMATVLKMLQVWQSGQVRVDEAPVVLPAGLQRALVDFIGQEVAGAKVDLQSDLAAAQQANGDLIAESERQSSTIELQAEAFDALQAEKAELAGRLGQLESDLARAIDDVAAERNGAELARTELAKAQLRLESMPRLEADLTELRADLAKERQARITAEQSSAVLASQKASLEERQSETKARADQLTKQLDHAQERNEQLTKDLADARVAVQAAQTRIESAAREIEDLKKATADAREQARIAGEQAAELRGQMAATKDPAAPASTKQS